MVLGWELFIGDHLGQVLAAASMLVPSVYQPHIGEAVAFRWALETARHLSFSRILFETDCLRIVPQWKNRHTQNNTYFAGFIQDCAILAGPNLKELKVLGTQLVSPTEYTYRS